MRLSFLIVAGVSLALAACGQPKHADGHIPPAEAEANYYAAQEPTAMAA